MFNYGKRPSVPEVGSYPGRNPGVALAVASTPAEAREDDDEGDDVEDHRDHREDQLHLQERERQPYLQPQIFVSHAAGNRICGNNIELRINTLFKKLKFQQLPVFITQKCRSPQIIFFIFSKYENLL